MPESHELHQVLKDLEHRLAERQLDTLGGAQIPLFYRQLDTLGGGLVPEYRRELDTLGGAEIPLYDRGF